MFLSAVRFSRKTCRFRYAYGEKPIITEDEFMEATEDLSHKKIRFASLNQTSSPLYDPEYDRFSDFVMQGGRRGLAESLIEDTFYNIKCIQFSKRKRAEKSGVDGKEEKIELNPLEIFKTAIKNCEPVVITKKVKRGGATYQVPYPLAQNQSEWFSYKWLLKAARDRPKPKKRLFPEAMATELLEAFNNQGKVVKMKDDMHKLAEANKAYAHYRWG